MIGWNRQGKCRNVHRLHGMVVRVITRFGQDETQTMPDLNHGDLSIEASAFGNGEAIPERFTAGGDNDSPALSWVSVPDSTRELVLLVHDPDAPLVDGFTHWVVTGIDPSANGLEENATEGFVSGTNSAGETGWMGPAPPPGHGTHHYFFHLFALDKRIEADAGTDRASLLKMIDGHILEQARVSGTFSL